MQKMAPNSRADRLFCAVLMQINVATRRQCLLLPCRKNHWSTPMMDLVMLTIGVAFFALSIGYVYACERL
jgi:hypothetical protein